MQWEIPVADRKPFQKIPEKLIAALFVIFVFIIPEERTKLGF